MKLKNWLVYSFTKNGLIVLSIVILAFAVVELVSVFTGHTLSIISGTGFNISWEPDPVAPRSFGRRFLFMTASVFVFVVAAYCLVQVSKLLGAIRKGTAFHERNFLRIKNVGAAILLSNLVLLVFSFLQLPMISGPRDDIDNALLTDQPQFSLVWVMVGFICLALSHAFRTGGQLQTEVDSFV